MRISPLFFGLAVAATLLSGAAMAQSAAPPPAPGAPVTPNEIKPIGDWTVRCFPVATPSPCDMYEELDDKTSRQRVLGVSIAYVPSNDTHVAQIAVPLGVKLSAGAVIQTDSYKSPPMPYRRCDRDGCYVELVIPPDVVGSLAKSGPNATLNIVADNGKAFSLRFSLNGFSSAKDTMTNLAKDKVKNAPAAAAKK